MTRGILLVGNESSLSAAVAAEAAKRVEQFAAAFIPNRFSNPAGEKHLPALEPLIPLSWNPGSPVSARTLILAAENRLQHIQEALLLCAPPAIRKAPEDLTSSEIEIMANDHIKGWFFLVKELAALFRLRQGGTLVLAISEHDGAGGKEEPPDILGQAVAASFRAFTQSVLAIAPKEPFYSMGFSAPASADTNAFASFIFKTLEEERRKNSGKWHKFGKMGLFKR
ncbi:MAG: hypothetical protein LBD24_06595 [Spirochaetaceae bacterium]|jgi:NAD(P)-dependent dehydrogenase (short-subunit alcohol dehydrogenase family)|nr:hypothetical protein [Spirochaetaceae bacterium]